MALRRKPADERIDKVWGWRSGIGSKDKKREMGKFGCKLERKMSGSWGWWVVGRCGEGVRMGTNGKTNLEDGKRSWWDFREWVEN
jgi:hypothetical protein